MTIKIETLEQLNDVLLFEVINHDDNCDCDYCITFALVAQLTDQD